MKVLRNILLLLFALINIKSTNGKEFITSDAVILEASNETTPFRNKRDIYFAIPHSFSTIKVNWGKNGLGQACLTSLGILGSCQNFKACYPFFKHDEPFTKFPQLSGVDSWILGNYDTCTYYLDDGRQAYGVCCTNPLQSVSTEIVTTKPNEGQKIDISTGSVFGSWPPPIPTHPPDHTPATHPPNFGKPVQQVTTQRPSGTTWATKPPSQQFTLSTTKKPSLITTTPENIFDKDDVPFGSDVGCGAKNGNMDQNRIVGGQNADPLEWPWIAVLFNGDRQFCGGSLIDDIHILSAAHCIAHFSSWDVARLTVRLGDYNIRISTEVKHIERKVKRIVRHKGFDSRTLYNDIAILTLDRKVPFSRGIRPVCLPSIASGTYHGQIATAVGWGSLRENGVQPSILQEVTLPIWKNEECKLKYGPAAPGGIINTMMCAGQAAKDSCSGDFSGPLVVNNGRWTQVGIVSWGIGCGKGQYPGVYTRVTSFLPWIEKNTKEA
ncbi:proclotting enzyme-like [Chironomus tepperi]|uniref:proclotting enzyme-like n=1 Tax=Chironomus tepperi TaxID=113505 RepID=UPI00391F649C